MDLSRCSPDFVALLRRETPEVFGDACLQPGFLGVALAADDIPDGQRRIVYDADNDLWIDVGPATATMEVHTFIKAKLQKDITHRGKMRNSASYNEQIPLEQLDRNVKLLAQLPASKARRRRLFTCAGA
mmetsp:Transcript_40413/g.75258  ORF Transcript_40413/g.75258 Transcript_40413/m.75258 type:complete len:129 (-) Transcript_40413:55-441(-)